MVPQELVQIYVALVRAEPDASQAAQHLLAFLDDAKRIAQTVQAIVDAAKQRASSAQ